MKNDKMERREGGLSIYYPPCGFPKAPGGRVLFGYHPGGNFCPREPVGTRGDPCGPRGAHKGPRGSQRAPEGKNSPGWYPKSTLPTERLRECGRGVVLFVSRGRGQNTLTTGDMRVNLGPNGRITVIWGCCAITHRTLPTEFERILVEILT